MNTDIDSPIILFDGICNFCSASVQFVIKRDARQRFRFCALQSAVGKKLLEEYSLQDSGLTSMILIHQSRAYNKSSAALAIAKHLDWPWPLLYGFIIVPRFIRDGVYDFIGNRRYQWFGKMENCWIPNDTLKKRFLDYETKQT